MQVESGEHTCFECMGFVVFWHCERLGIQRTFVVRGGKFEFGLIPSRALQWTMFPVVHEGTNAIVELYDVAFGKGKFLAIERSGGTYSAPASEPHIWTPGARIHDADLEAIKFANGKFVVVGQDTKATRGLFLSSTDGTNWTRQEFENVQKCWDVAYGNGWFVVVGDDFVGRSTNAVDWAIETNLVISPPAFFRSIDFVNGEFMATFFGERHPNLPFSPMKLAISTNGTNWEEHSLLWGEGYRQIAYGRKVYVSLGVTDCGGCGWAYFSVDGRTWRDRSYPVRFDGWAVEYANGVFAISGSFGQFLSSTNGMTWEEFQIGSSKGFYGLTFGSGRFVAVGYGVVAVSEFVGEVRHISNMQVNAEAIEFDFNAEERTEWQVEASEDLVNWVVLQEIEGTVAELERVNVPRQGEAVRFLRLKEKR